MVAGLLRGITVQTLPSSVAERRPPADAPRRRRTTRPGVKRMTVTLITGANKGIGYETARRLPPCRCCAGRITLWSSTWAAARDRSGQSPTPTGANPRCRSSITERPRRRCRCLLCSTRTPSRQSTSAALPPPKPAVKSVAVSPGATQLNCHRAARIHRPGRPGRHFCAPQRYLRRGTGGSRARGGSHSSGRWREHRGPAWRTVPSLGDNGRRYL
jgi:hypothetical protein